MVCQSKFVVKLLLVAPVLVAAGMANRARNRRRHFGRHFNQSRGEFVPAWLPRCFKASSFQQMYQCISEFASPSCLNGQASLQDTVQCVVDELPDDTVSASSVLNQGRFYVRTIARNLTTTCLDSYVDCVNATIQDRKENFQPCARRSLRRLTRCARRNADTCFDNCTDTVSSISNLRHPFDNLDSTDLETCVGIQDEVVNPSCDIFTCCTPCVDEYQAVMDCLVNDVLNYTEAACDLQCPQVSSPTRQLDENDDDEDDGENDDLSEACLEFAPGMTAKDAEELAVRSEYFMPCLIEEFVGVMEDEHLNPQETSTSGAAKRQILLSFLGAATMLTFFGWI